MLNRVPKYLLVNFLCLIVLSAVLSQCAKRLVNDVDESEAAKRHIDAAKAYIDERNSRKALGHLQKSEKFEKKSVELFHTYALLYRLEGDAKREEYYYKKALDQDKNNSRTKNNYGSFLCFHGNAPKGIKYLVEATEDYAYKGRAETYVNRGYCELNLKDISAAEHSFQQALRLNAQSIMPQLELAAIYLNKNDLRTANFYYQQFVAKSPQQSARSLWLGIQVARGQNDKNSESSYALLLQKIFPKSEEYQAYLKSIP